MKIRFPKWFKPARKELVIVGCVFAVWLAGFFLVLTLVGGK